MKKLFPRPFKAEEPFKTMNTAQPAKNLAQTIAKQITQEPWEILKEAGNQVFPQEAQGQGSPNQNSNPEQAAIENNKLLEERDKVKSQRLIEALTAELRDKTKGDLIKNLQEKIARGEDVYLDNYPSLTIEEKESLKKQMEVVRIQKAQTASQTPGLIEPASKKGRRLFNFGKKTQMQRQQTQTERPLPPSG